MSKNNSAREQELTGEESSRANLADIPKIDDMLALYERVLSEIDADIASQQNFTETN